VTEGMPPSTTTSVELIFARTFQTPAPWQWHCARCAYAGVVWWRYGPSGAASRGGSGGSGHVTRITPGGGEAGPCVAKQCGDSNSSCWWSSGVEVPEKVHLNPRQPAARSAGRGSKCWTVMSDCTVARIPYVSVLFQV